MLTAGDYICWNGMSYGPTVEENRDGLRTKPNHVLLGRTLLYMLCIPPTLHCAGHAQSWQLEKKYAVFWLSWRRTWCFECLGDEPILIFLTEAFPQGTKGGSWIFWTGSVLYISISSSACCHNSTFCGNLCIVSKVDFASESIHVLWMFLDYHHHTAAHTDPSRPYCLLIS